MINIHFLSKNEQVSAKVILDTIGLSSNPEKPTGDRVELILLREQVKLNLDLPLLLIKRTDYVRAEILNISEELLSHQILDISHLKKISENAWQIDIDVLSIVESIVFRYEEKEKTILDEHQRFRATFSLLFNSGVLEKPVVNYIIEFMKSAIDEILRASGLIMPYIERWQNGSKFTVSITIDLDHIRKHPLPLSLINPFSSIKHFDIKNTKKNLGLAYKSVSRSNKVLIDMDKLLNYSGERITLFACGRRRHSFDPEVSADNYRASYMIKSLVKVGAEISLHGSYASMFNGANLGEERKLLENVAGRSVEGVRMHYVRLRIPETLHEIERNGFLYDSSLTYASTPGFRAGIAMPFKALSNYNLHELPPALMDSTLFFRQKLSYDEALRRSLIMLDEIERVGGYSAFIFHNQHLVYDEYSVVGKFLLTLRDEIKKRRGDTLTCIDTVRWWSARELSSVYAIKESGSYIVKFDISPMVLNYGKIGFLGDVGKYAVRMGNKEVCISTSVKCNPLKKLRWGFAIIRLKK